MRLRSPVSERIAAVYERHRHNHQGSVANYIPELAIVDPDTFGIAVGLADGHLYEVGDSRHEFTIQSVSKAFTFGLALRDHGHEVLLSRVGVEPTGERFNAIVLDEVGNRPPNPMVNAGAIAITGLVKGSSAEERWARIIGTLGAFAGRSLEVDDAVARSETETGHRNRAIAHLMRGFGMLRPDVDEVLDLYFRQCAVKVTAADLALMGATLATGGRHPVTDEQVLAPEEAAAVMSVMSSCGMYDSSGEWIYRVGIPAKSGVGGGIVAVLPGRAAIGVFAPRLDGNGNSVRGLLTCEELSREFGMNLFNERHNAIALRAAYGRDVITSRYKRLVADDAVLRQHGSEIGIVELQGALGFTALEQLSRHVVDRTGSSAEVILDFRRVPECEPEAALLLIALLEECLLNGVAVSLASVPDGEIADAASGLSHRVWPAHVGVYDSLDAAMEAAEDRLLVRYGLERRAQSVTVGELDVCAGFDADDLAAFAAVTRELAFAAGACMARPGDPAGSAWLILEGEATVSAAGRMDGEPGRRLRTVGAGSILGEMALLSGAPRSAWVHADTAVRALELDAAALERLTDMRPRAAVTLLRNIANLLARWLRDADPNPTG